jgi:hypothetical protein
MNTDFRLRTDISFMFSRNGNFWFTWRSLTSSEGTQLHSDKLSVTTSFISSQGQCITNTKLQRTYWENMLTRPLVIQILFTVFLLLPLLLQLFCFCCCLYFCFCYDDYYYYILIVVVFPNLRLFISCLTCDCAVFV